MIIYGNRNIQSEEYKISKLDYMLGKEIWTIARMNVPDIVDFEKSIWRDDWKTYYIKILDTDYSGRGYRIAFFYFDDVAKGIYSLYDEDRIKEMLVGANNVFTGMRPYNIECDFKEIVSTEELYDILTNTKYDWRARLED